MGEFPNRKNVCPECGGQLFYGREEILPFLWCISCNLKFPPKIYPNVNLKMPAVKDDSYYRLTSDGKLIKIKGG